MDITAWAGGGEVTDKIIKNHVLVLASDSMAASLSSAAPAFVDVLSLLHQSAVPRPHSPPPP